MLTRIHDRLGLRTSPTLFFGSLGITVLFVALTLHFTDAVNETFSKVSGWIITNLGWFYISGVTIFLLFLLYLAGSRFGRVRLSPRDEAPDHSFIAWFSMLFAAGIGTILMFWGVAEPVSHFATPPMQDVEPVSVAAAEEAMAFTLYHFGLHTWTIFALPSLGFAYFIYQRNLPPRVSSIFYPSSESGSTAPSAGPSIWSRSSDRSSASPCPSGSAPCRSTVAWRPSSASGRTRCRRSSSSPR